ncbi:MAG: hypothetical protein AAF191_21345, partial [Verrucomicrobiota bacterium]
MHVQEMVPGGKEGEKRDERIAIAIGLAVGLPLIFLLLWLFDWFRLRDFVGIWFSPEPVAAAHSESRIDWEERMRAEEDVFRILFEGESASGQDVEDEPAPGDRRTIERLQRELGRSNARVQDLLWDLKRLRSQSDDSKTLEEKALRSEGEIDFLVAELESLRDRSRRLQRESDELRKSLCGAKSLYDQQVREGDRLTREGMLRIRTLETELREKVGEIGDLQRLLEKERARRETSAADDAEKEAGDMELALTWTIKEEEYLLQIKQLSEERDT